MTSKTAFSTLAGSAMPSLDGRATTGFATTTPRAVGGRGPSFGWNLSLASNTPPPAPSIMTTATVGVGTAPNLHQLQHLSQNLDDGGATAADGSTTGVADEPFVSVADLLERKKIEIIQNVVDTQMEKVRLELEQAAEERLAQTWEAEKERFLQELAGDRVLGGSCQTVPKSSSMHQVHTRGGVRSTTKTENLSHLAQSHVQIVARTTGDKTTIFMAEDLARTETAAPAYRMALQLVYALQEPQQPPGNTSPTNTTTLQQAHASLKHLAHQYQRHMTHVVQQASLAGQDVSIPTPLSHSMANTILTCTKLQHGSSAATIWHHLYYALRCGDAVAGAELLRTSNSLQPAITTRVQQLAQHQGPSGTCLWESSDKSLPEATNKADLTDLLARRQNAATPYELAVLDLLLLDKGASSSFTGVLQTIEDYVYVQLYLAGDDEHALEGLGASIRDFGPAHFETSNPHQSDGGWSFAFPLLLTQQYRSALGHLAQTGGPRGLLEATHLGILLGPDLSKLDVGADPVDSSYCVLTSLLVEFARQLQPVDPEAAVVYLVRIPTAARKQTELARLLIETRQFERLAGVVDVNGKRFVPPNRPAPALVTYLNGDEAQVSAALQEAGRLAQNVRDSCELFRLAERYDLLLQRINEELARLLEEPIVSAERKYWMDAAGAFYQAHFGATASKDYVTTVLEQRHATGRATTMHTLLKLMEAVDRLTKQDFKAATAMLDDLGWIPSAPEEVATKAALYHHRLAGDAALQRVYGPVLAQATKALFAQWNLVKHSGMMMDASTPVPQRLKSLQMQAQAILSLAGRVGSSKKSSVDDETIANMTNMVAHMASR